MSHSKKNNSIVLASTSPRRRDLISRFHHPILMRAPEAQEEPPNLNEAPTDYVKRMATLKALSASNTRNATDLVIGADTIVWLNDEIFGKPSSIQDASRMLSFLRNTTHNVSTSMVLIPANRDDMLIVTSTVSVTMRNYSDVEIEEYVKTGDPMDKAGAYAIQHRGFHPVKTYDGCYTSVLGLPLCTLSISLKRCGVKICPVECGVGIDSEYYVAPSKLKTNNILDKGDLR
ncbi:MAG: Maf family protein [Dehalococcoidia bacterium]